MTWRAPSGPKGLLYDSITFNAARRRLSFLAMVVLDRMIACQDPSGYGECGPEWVRQIKPGHITDDEARAALRAISESGIAEIRTNWHPDKGLEDGDIEEWVYFLPQHDRYQRGRRGRRPRSHTGERFANRAPMEHQIGHVCNTKSDPNRPGKDKGDQPLTAQLDTITPERNLTERKGISKSTAPADERPGRLTFIDPTSATRMDRAAVHFFPDDPTRLMMFLCANAPQGSNDWKVPPESRLKRYDDHDWLARTLELLADQGEDIKASWPYLSAAVEARWRSHEAKRREDEWKAQKRSLYPRSTRP